MNTMKKTAAGAVLGGALLAAGGFGLAHAAPPAQPSVLNDGKVNVTVTVNGQEIGVIRDVTLTNAESLATSACGNAGITADALKALDANGTPVPGTCAGVDGGPTFTFAQNTPGESPPASSSSTTTSTTPTTTTASAR
jgi:hypothetical protein